MKVPHKSFVTVSLSAVVAGGVFAFGFPWPLLPLALAVFFWKIATEVKTLKHTLLCTSLFFWLYYIVVLSWFLDTDLSLLAGLSKKSGPFVLGFSLFAMTTVMTIASLPFGSVVYALRARFRRPGLLALSVISFSWALIEWLRSIAFSLFLYAPNASIGDYWNFGSLGLGIIETPIGYLGRMVGMYGLSMVVVALGITFYWAARKHYKPMILVIVLVSAGSLVSYALVPRNVSEPIQARLLQGDSQFSGQTPSPPIRNKSESKKDLIVLPEYSRLYDAENSSFTEKYVTDQLDDSGVVLDVTADFTNPGPRKSYLQTRDKNHVVDTQTKRLLIPTGEYLPNIVTGFYSLTGQDQITDDFSRTRGLEKGAYPKLVDTDKLKIAPVACSGILGRNIYRQLVNDGGNVLTNSASLATFSGSSSYFRQSLQMARFHAVANNRTYVQATVGAPGFVIDNNGRYILSPDGTATEFADFTFTPATYKTIYTKFGDWPLMLGAAFLTGLGLSLVVRQLRKSSK